ncbi:hypothetical protein ACRCPS_18300 [Pseudomonas aeruginosa]
MNPIHLAAQMMGKRKIRRRATAKREQNTVFIWELDDGNALELVRKDKGFVSVVERTEGFDALVEYYSRSNAHVFSPNNVSAA